MHGIFVGNWSSNDDKSYPLRSVFTDTFVPPWRGIIAFRYTLLYICATFFFHLGHRKSINMPSFLCYETLKKED